MLSEFRVCAGSAYGVLAVDCTDNIDATIKWIEDSTSASFEGQVVPFCYPDKHFGPDLLFLMWNDLCTKFCSCLSQAKFKEDLNETDALRTITPSLLYHENRGKKGQRVSRFLKQGPKARWEQVKPKLIGETHGCLRLIVQYPCHEKLSARPGIIRDEFSTVAESKKADKQEQKKCGQKRKYGWLSTVSGDNASDFFGKSSFEC